MNAQDLDTEILTASETEVVIEQTNYLNCFQRLCNVIKQITLEPCVLLFFMAYSMGAPMQTAVMVDKVYMQIVIYFLFKFYSNKL